MTSPQLPETPNKRCFVVTAIGNPGSPEREHSDKVLNYLIKPVCENLGYEAIRVDTESINGNINDRIINHLKNDELVIADLTGHNPNAFFELGYRQALGLPLIPIITDSDHLPFDVISENTVFYNTDVSKIEDSKEQLSAMIMNFKDYIMPNEQPQRKTEFDKINDKLDILIKQTKPKLEPASFLSNQSYATNTMLELQKTMDNLPKINFTSYPDIKKSILSHPLEDNK